MIPADETICAAREIAGELPDGDTAERIFKALERNYCEAVQRRQTTRQTIILREMRTWILMNRHRVQVTA